MNPVLVDSILVRMREQTTEQLLELWTTNDRATWSPEAFEAVKSLLAERGMRELPRQNEPAPMAQTHSPAQDPAARYWLAWLRPVLWIGIVVSCLTLFYQAVAAWESRHQGGSFWADDPLDLVLGIIQYMLLPPLLIVGSVACFRFIPWSRAALLTYAWVAILALVVEFLWQVRRTTWDHAAVLYGLAGEALRFANQLVLPLVLLVLLRRPEMSALFTHARPGSGFEPAVSGETATESRRS